MSYERILYEQRGEVALITLNRPDKLNAWTPQMSVEQADAIERANADRSIGAIKESLSAANVIDKRFVVERPAARAAAH